LGRSSLTPAIQIPSVRTPWPVHGKTATVTVPGPVPDDPLVTVTWGVLALIAVHRQLLPCVTATLNVAVPPARGTVTCVGVALIAQGTPSCATVTV